MKTATYSVLPVDVMYKESSRVNGGIYPRLKCRSCECTFLYEEYEKAAHHIKSFHSQE